MARAVTVLLFDDVPIASTGRWSGENCDDAFEAKAPIGTRSAGPAPVRAVPARLTDQTQGTRGQWEYESSRGQNDTATILTVGVVASPVADPAALGEGAVQQDEVRIGLAQDLEQTW